MSRVYQNMIDSAKRSVAMTGAQLRAARGLLNMSASELSERTGLALNTIRRAEASESEVPITAANRMLLVSTLEEAGVVFIAADDLGEGVRLKGADVLKSQRRRNATSGS